MFFLIQLSISINFFHANISHYQYAFNLQAKHVRGSCADNGGNAIGAAASAELPSVQTQLSVASARSNEANVQ